MKITWGGHSTAKIEFQKNKILTDPNLAPRLFFHRRFSRPGLTDTDLLDVNTVIVSHAHLDHADHATFKRIPKSAKAISRERISELTAKFGLRSRGLKLWETLDMGPLRITCLPVQHFGGRWQVNGDFHKYKFASYMLEADGLVVYFGGDTAYNGHFKQIAQKFPKIDVALLPIGAYEPRTLMRRNHVNPQEAFKAFLDLKAKHFIPIHYGTFKLTTEPLDAPIKILLRQARRHKMESKIRVLEPGQSWRI